MQSYEGNHLDAICCIIIIRRLKLKHVWRDNQISLEILKKFDLMIIYKLK